MKSLAADYIARKTQVPSEMRSKEWSRVDVWVRERAFFMASVAQAELLDGFYQRVHQVTKGEMGESEARAQLLAMLRDTGYKPLPGQEGTIKDLTSEARMQVVLRTNVAMAHGYAAWTRQQKALHGFPAQRFLRVQQRNVPRRWLSRWAQARAGREAGSTDGPQMVALLNHPLWMRLSAFGTPYPPFDFNSGMGVEPVDREEAEKLGLLEGDGVPEMMQPQNRGLNETLESSAQIRSEKIRAALQERLAGFAEFEGDKIVFTDPNGTRPYAPEKLAEVWDSARVPELFKKLPGGGLMQKEAFVKWAQDNRNYTRKKGDGTFEAKGDTDMWEDFLRFMGRLIPTGKEKKPMFRSLGFANEEKFRGFLDGLETEKSYRPRAALYPAESWTGSISSARKYLGKSRFRVILRLPDGHRLARDISPLVRAFRDEIQAGENPEGKLAFTDDELILPSIAKMKLKRVGRVTETPEGKIVEVYLEESM